MVNEIFISLYLFVFKGIFNLFKWFPLKHKVTFVVSFGENSLFVYREMLRRKVSYDVVFLNTGSADLKQQVGAKIITFKTTNIIGMIRSVYHLATSKNVIIDNYFGFLSAVHFREGVECIQLWHAAGAMKRFGLKDKTVSQRSDKAKRRFRRVYQKFDKIVVGSEEMARIFMEAFDLPPEHFLRTGIPRTDLFYDQSHQRDVVADLTNDNPVLKHKKVILYAPTYRDDQLNHANIKLDLDLLKRELGDEYALLLRFHPAVRAHSHYEVQYPDFVYDYSLHENVNELLLVTDYLVTDYSSIPYEFALLGRPMIFFPNDLVYYENHRGLWGDYDSLVPGPVVHSTLGIVESIKKNTFYSDQMQPFARKWNQYSDGHSSEKLVSYLLNHDQRKLPG